MNNILELLEINPIIAAIRDEKDVDEVIKCKADVVFLLSANLLNIKGIVQTIKNHGKKVCVHVDLIDGLGRCPAAIDYIKEHVNPDGYITTRVNLAKYAKKAGLFTIQRLFIIDSHSLDTGIKNVLETGADAVEVMPGIASKLIRRLKGKINVPIIAGGLISSKDDIIDSLSVGVHAISTSTKELWNM